MASDKNEPRKKRLRSCYVEPDLDDWLIKEANRENRSVSGQMSHFLDEIRRNRESKRADAIMRTKPHKTDSEGR